MENAREQIQQMTELALWAGRPDEALELVHRGLDLATKAPYLTKFCGRLLSSGMRACADMAERARASSGMSAAAALAAADELADWVEHTGDEALTNHPFVAATPAERATWNAERTRVVNSSDPDASERGGDRWQNLGCPHQAGCRLVTAGRRSCRRQQPGGGRGSSPASNGRRERAAAFANPPTRAASSRPAATRLRPRPRPGWPKTLHTRTVRRGNWGAALHATGRATPSSARNFRRPRSAGVDVTDILRKLGVPTPVQAAAVAGRPGMLIA